MLLLAADTSGKHGSIALARCGPGDVCEVLEVVPLTGGTFSAQLVPQIAELLTKHGFTKQDLEGFAVTSGPGSFTGLRVGLAAIKALAEVLEKPLAAVSLLEILAVTGGVTGEVTTALDAGRGEIYSGEYEAGNIPRLIAERLLTKDEFLAQAKGRTVVTCENAIASLGHATASRIIEIDAPRSDAIARLGWRKIQAGQIVSPEDLEANYIRRSDAEIFSKPRV